MNKFRTVTLAAVLLFAIIGSKVVPSAIGVSSHNASTNLLLVAFLLNIAIVLFGWRRARELAETLATLKQAENEAYINAYSDHTTGLPNRRSLLREIDASVERRAKFWKRDAASREKYEASIAPNRARLAKMLGVVDGRVKDTSPQYVSGPDMAIGRAAVRESP